jgi:hypothetical protein
MEGVRRWDRPANPLSGFLAFASGMWARTSDLRRLFGCLTLGAAVLARRCHARTERVCTLLGFRRVHFLFSPNFGSSSDDPSPNASSQEKVFLYRNEHIAISVALAAAVDGNPLASATSPATSLRTAGAEFCGFPDGESRVASPAPRVSNCEQMFADSRVILSVHSTGRKRGCSFSGASF